MRTRQHDCLIIGGGPAGSMLAWELQRQGRSVALVDHGRAHYSGPYETVLGSTRALWDRMGLLEQLKDGVVADPLRHGAIWGQDEVQWREPGDAGLLLRRGVFDQAFRDAARVAGAEVFEGERAAQEGDQWRVGDELLAPALVAYATGRAATPPLPKVRVTGPVTTAVTALGEPASGDRNSAVVEAVEDGWIWTHCPNVGQASAAVLVDRDRLKRQPAEEALTEIFSAAQGPAHRLRGWRVAHANDATMWDRGVARDHLVLGDAAATIDPLASQGVEKAVSAAGHAACVVATALERPEWWPRLCALHSRWEMGLQAAHRRSATEFYLQEQRFVAADFWRQRGRATGLAGLAGDPILRLRPTISVGPVLMRHGPRYIETEGAVDADTGEELARIARVPVTPLVKIFAETHTVSEAVGLASQQPSLYVLSPREVHDAILQLAGRGWLTPQA
jgi:2-polyprenyl-6-methoxyphenol hydroxylase-like FAD-dependent oxidoreductase